MTRLFRRTLLASAAMLPLALPAMAQAVDPLAPVDPLVAGPRYVVSILIDDIGCANAQCHNIKGMPTPNLDAIAAAGVTFTHVSSTGPLCDPTRVSRLLGRYSQEAPTAIYTNPPSHTGFPPIPPETVTIAEAFKAKDGRATGAIGKYAVMQQLQYLPLQSGYDEFFGFLTNGQNYVNSSVWRGNQPIGKEKEHLTSAFAREMVSFIDRHAGEQFFLDGTPSATHMPYQYTADQYRRCKGAPFAQRPYCAMLVGFDDYLGRIIAALQAHGIFEDTLIMIAGDNGFENEARVPHIDRGEKGTRYLGGVHVPMWISWPNGGLPAGTQYDWPVNVFDMYDTALGRDVPETESVNLLPYLRGTTPGAPHEYQFFASQTNAGSIYSFDFWKLYVTPIGRIELYAVNADPGEKHNVAAANPIVVNRMLPVLQQWRRSLPPPATF